MADITGTNSSETINGTNDRDYIQGLDGIDTIYGKNGNDTIYGGLQTDYLYGQAGDDWLAPDGGFNNIVDGGEGIDTAAFQFEYLPVIVDLSQVNASGYSVATVLGGGSSNLLNIENLYGGASQDFLTGDSGANTIWGNNGTDMITSGGGNDRLFGGAGTDFMNGGAGNDVLNGYNYFATNSVESDSLIGGAGADKFILGDPQKAYYVGDGHALIKDFNKSQDVIQLKGSRYDYNLIESQGSTTIYHGGNTGPGGDIVAVLEGATNISFTTSAFSFVP